MICSKCQLQNWPDSTFCARCGKRLHFFCPACGVSIMEEINYCMKCGQDFSVNPPTLLLEHEQEREERHREYYVPRVRSARIAPVLHSLLGLSEDGNASDMRRDHLEHSLCYVFEDPWLSLHDDSDVGGFLHDYWRAVKELWPEAFNDSNEYCIRDMLGFSILNSVFPDVIQLCRKSSDFSKETMKLILAQIGVGSDFWREGNMTHGEFHPGTRSFIPDTAPFITSPESCISAATAFIREKLGVTRVDKTTHITA